MNENMELNELKKAISNKLEKLITIKSTKDSNQEYKGYVLKFSDGVARVLGITKARIGQRLTFYSEIINENGEKTNILIDGMIMDIEPQWTECIVFGEERFIKEGQTVEIKAEDRNLPFTINYSDSYLGKVIDPLCNVQKIDNDTAESEGVDDTNIHKLSIEVPAPLIANRAPVNKPLFTGIKVVDSVLPIGLGQRMLIIGDRGTGKSALAKTMMINYGINGSVGIEKSSDLKNNKKVFIYTAIGKKISEIKSIYSDLSKANIDFIVVLTKANDPASLVYIAPFAATSIAEYYRDLGRDVVIVYDDLTNHANAYRHVSLLLKRPPGREAYPGDIFYLHSRLLERSSNVFLKKTKKGYKHSSAEEWSISNQNQKDKDFITASITALPIVQTKESDFSAYVPTNIVSITDGQIYLDPTLMNNDVFPAVHVGLSVSRLGGDAQNNIIKALTKSIKGDLAAYNDKMKYSTYGLELDEIGTKAIYHGKRIILFFKQRLLETSSELDTAKGISLIYMCKYFEELFWGQLNKENVIQYEKQLSRLLKKPFENSGPELNKKSSKKLLLDKYFALNKFGMIKPDDVSKISDKFIILKNDNYMILREFVDFFHLEEEKKVEDMTLDEIYDSLVKVIVAK